MLRIVIDTTAADAIGVKECITYFLERFGDCKVVSVTDLGEQMKLEDKHA